MFVLSQRFQFLVLCGCPIGRITCLARPSVRLSRTGSELENKGLQDPKLAWTFPRHE